MNDRQRLIAVLLDRHEVTSQQQLVELLQSQKVSVTQATVSRDLEQLGALKVRQDGKIAYALPGQFGAGATPSRLVAVLRDWVRSIEVAATIVVLKTPPGSAHLVGVALDESALSEIVGTICGDDTIFAACRSSELARVRTRSCR